MNIRVNNYEEFFDLFEDCERPMAVPDYWEFPLMLRRGDRRLVERDAGNIYLIETFWYHCDWE